MVLLVGIVCAIYLKDDLDKLVSLSGSIMGTTVVMTIPALCHYKLVAKTKMERIVDITLLFISIVVTIVTTYQIA